jgi:hypothetical protein
MAMLKCALMMPSVDCKDEERHFEMHSDSYHIYYCLHSSTTEVT